MNYQGIKRQNAVRHAGILGVPLASGGFQLTALLRRPRVDRSGFAGAAALALVARPIRRVAPVGREVKRNPGWLNNYTITGDTDRVREAGARHEQSDRSKEHLPVESPNGCAFCCGA